MPIAYDVKTTALTVGVAPKWLDNLLSHHSIPGVQRARQGVERRISKDGLLAIEVVRMLFDDLGVSLARAAEIVAFAFQHRGDADLSFATKSGIRLDIPVGAIVPRLQQRVADAIEAVPRVRRGRPPRDGALPGLRKSRRGA